MRVPINLWSLTAVEILNLIGKDAVTVEDYAKSLLSRIESRDSVVKAWQFLGMHAILAFQPGPRP